MAPHLWGASGLNALFPPVLHEAMGYHEAFGIITMRMMPSDILDKAQQSLHFFPGDIPEAVFIPVFRGFINKVMSKVCKNSSET